MEAGTNPRSALKTGGKVVQPGVGRGKTLRLSVGRGACGSPRRQLGTQAWGCPVHGAEAQRIVEVLGEEKGGRFKGPPEKWRPWEAENEKVDKSRWCWGCPSWRAFQLWEPSECRVCPRSPGRQKWAEPWDSPQREGCCWGWRPICGRSWVGQGIAMNQKLEGLGVTWV